MFTEKEKATLLSNPNVKSITVNGDIRYSVEFRELFLQQYDQGLKPTAIFRKAGFDPAVLGEKRIERASARWRKKREEEASKEPEDEFYLDGVGKNREELEKANETIEQQKRKIESLKEEVSLLKDKWERRKEEIMEDGMWRRRYG